MRILFVCSEFFAGMMPFGASVVNIMQQSEHEVFGVFVFSPDCDYRKEIDNSHNGRFVFLPAPKNKIERELFRLSAFKVYEAIDKICKQNSIDIIHFLTEDTSLAWYVKRLKKNHTVVYTVHDLKAHDEKIKGNLLRYMVRHLFVTQRVRYFLKHTDNLITCSKNQYELLEKYKENGKHIFFHNFPSLVTKAIRSGNKKVKELENVDDYILFFGRLEMYKGVEILYSQYIQNPSLQNRKLVIAGSGRIYFERDVSKEKNIIFINRYVSDEEINDLYGKAGVVVYPYISATQSGVVSLGLHFQKPVVVSNIPFLKDCIVGAANTYVFDLNNPNTLTNILEGLKQKNGNDTMPGSNPFNDAAIRKQLQNIYNNYSVG